MSTTTSSSVITTLSVSSSGEIRFLWDGIGEHLVAPEVDPTRSTVSGPGAQPVGAPPPQLTLAGWTAQAPIRLVAGSSPTIEMLLTPPTPPLPIVFQPGRSVTINFSLQTASNGTPASHMFRATATVDAPFADVVKAVKDLDAPGASGPGIKQDLDYVTGFPLQVYDSSGMPSGGGGGGGGGGASATPTARAMIDAQMKAVLGRSTGTSGVAGTLAALDRSFQPVVSGGVDTWVWQPGSYTVQSDIGAGVTGEQASLATLASTVGQEILPLIANLTPLVPEASVNPDEIAAFKAIIASSWPAFVNEIGANAGPRINRATSLLQDVGTSLVNLGVILGMYASGTTLGAPPAVPPVGLPLGVAQFDPLTDSSWPAPDRSNGVVTGDDEENYTNFVIATDRVKMVNSRFKAFYLTAPPRGVPSNEDRGFLVTLLQRSLDAASEAADAVYAALDSVNLGQDEREVIFVPGTDPKAASGYAGTGALSVEDIVSWAAAFPAQEATPLLQDAGNVGIGSLSVRAGDIGQMVTLLENWIGGNPATPVPPPGLAHPRVTYALDILSDALQDITTYAGNPQLGYTPPTGP